MAYIEERIRPRIKWYDRRAVMCKRTRLIIDVGTTLLSVALIVLIESTIFPRIGLSIIAGVIAVMIAIDKIGAYGEKWLHYRMAAEALEAELLMRNYNAGPYAISPAGADQLLVERAEAILNREAQVWLSLTRIGELSFERKLGG